VLVVVSIIALLLSILLPSLTTAREATRSAVCLSQLRQMAIAAQTYTNTYAGSYPPYLDTVYSPEFDFMTFTRKIEYGWDFSRVSDGPAGKARIVPGLIWQGRMPPQIQQCPSFGGPAMWADDRYTGYNYNSSYVGAFLKKKRKTTTTTGATVLSWEIAVKPAKQDQIRRAGECAVFGDGEYAGGANKFMRSPWGLEKGARDYWVSSERGAGTQGYRHLKRTNVAFADGHGESRIQRYTQTYDFQRDSIPDNVGYLSADNSMYSLDPQSDRQAINRVAP
jgi:prepilin-type processing-associated H-X9-DG protein